MLSPYATIMESMFQVINREGQLVPFKLLPAQLALDSALTGRDIVPKSRQLGISSYVIGRFTARCLAKTNQRCVIISHEEESTKRLFAKAKTILENLRSPRKDIVIEADIGRLTQAAITFKDTGSWLVLARHRAVNRPITYELMPS